MRSMPSHKAALRGGGQAVTVSASTLQQCVAGGHTPSAPTYSLHPHEAHLLLQLGCVRCYCAVLGDVKGALLFCRAAGRMRIWTSCGAAEPSNDGMKGGGACLRTTEPWQKLLGGTCIATKVLGGAAWANRAGTAASTTLSSPSLVCPVAPTSQACCLSSW